MRFVEVHRKDDNNVGDLYSNPLRYFAPEQVRLSIDIASPFNKTWNDKDILVAGGGGLIGNEHFGDYLEDLLKSPDLASLNNMWNNRWVLGHTANTKVYNVFHEKMTKLIREAEEALVKNKGAKVIWGAGINERSTGMSYKLPKWIKKYDLVGIRDDISEFDWVPCASCMHPAFDQKYKVTNEVVFFEHKKQLLKPTQIGKVPMPRFANSGSNFEQIIQILGSANTVITNSYHGVYWATLLGKKVVCMEPWSNKFRFFKHAPLFATTKDRTESLIKDAPTHPTALQDCRDANQTFWRKVSAL